MQATIKFLCVNYKSLPLVTSELGDIKSISVTWESCVEYYGSGNHTRSVRGEEFSIYVYFDKLPRPIGRTWKTYFPDWTPVNTLSDDINKPGFWRCDIQPEYFFESLWSHLSPFTIDKIALESKNFRLREAAIKRFTDRALLLKVILEDKDERIHRAAVDRYANRFAEAIAPIGELTDKAILAKIVAEDKDFHVSRAAANRLLQLRDPPNNSR